VTRACFAIDWTPRPSLPRTSEGVAHAVKYTSNAHLSYVRPVAG
jgi:hypothetical protein